MPRTLDEKVFRTLLSSPVPIAIFSWRAIVEEGWPVDFVSPNVVHVLGWTAEDFLAGRAVYSEIIHPDDRTRVMREVEEHTRSGAEVFEHEDYRILDPEGRTRWVRDLTAVIRDDGGQLTHYFGFILESSARHEALVALADAKHEAEVAASAKADFLAMVSHELRTPLTLILAPVDSLLDGAAGPLNEAARRDLQRIARNAERLHGLVDDLLDFARLEEGHTEPRWEEVDTGALLGALVEEARSLATARGLALSLDVSGLSEPSVTDRAMLERITLNLSLIHI